MLHRRANGLHRPGHRIEPLVQDIEPGERGGRYALGASRPQRLDGPGGSLPQIVQCAALGLGWMHGPFDPPGRLLRQRRSVIAIAEIRLVTSPFALAPGAGFSLRRVARVSDGVEAGLLLVAHGIVEALEGRRTRSTARSMASRRFAMAPSRASGVATASIGQAACSTSTALAEAVLSWRSADCCACVGATVCSIRSIGQSVRPGVRSPQNCAISCACPAGVPARLWVSRGGPPGTPMLPTESP